MSINKIIGAFLFLMNKSIKEQAIKHFTGYTVYLTSDLEFVLKRPIHKQYIKLYKVYDSHYWFYDDCNNCQCEKWQCQGKEAYSKISEHFYFNPNEIKKVIDFIGNERFADWIAPAMEQMERKRMRELKELGLLS